MNVWILQTGEPLPGDDGNPRPMRAINLANALVSKGHQVTIWSSAFNHASKQHRCKNFAVVQITTNMTLRFLPSRGYSRNIGLGRLVDHAQLAIGLATCLARDDLVEPDVAFVGYPPIECAAVFLRWLHRRSVPSIIDVKDLWPALFLEPIPPAVRPIAKLALAPYFWLGRRALRDATCFCSMSEDYLEWMAAYADRKLTPIDIVAPLTVPEPIVEPSAFAAATEWWRAKGVDLENRRRVFFVGTLNSVFDFSQIRNAAKRFSEGDIQCQFVICGSGSCESEVRALMRDLNNVVFPGWVDRQYLVPLANGSIGSLLPYKNIENFTRNLPNKVIDSMALGVPILTELEGSVARLVEEEGIGICYSARESDSCYSAILNLLSDPKRQSEMARRARNLYEQRFSYEKVYGELVNRIESLGSKQNHVVL